MDITLSKIANFVIEGNAGEIPQLVQTALQDGQDPQEILNQGLIAGMDVVGKRFKEGDMYVPEVIASSKAMHAGLDLLKPLLSKSSGSQSGVVILGTIKGDVHDIGKSLVSSMLEGAGFEVVDIGVDVAPERFVEVCLEKKAHIIGISSLLTTTMVHMPAVLHKLEQEGLREQIKVMIGGAPVTTEYAQQIGADGYAADAASAVDVARDLMARRGTR